MRSLKRLLGWALLHWKKIVGAALVLGATLFLLLYKLGSLTGGVSSTELAQRSFAGNWHHISHNPLSAPVTVVQWLLLNGFSHQGKTVMRLASLIFGIASIGAMAYVLRRWYGRKTAIYGSVLFATSAWLLHVSRYNSVDIVYLWAIPTLIAAQIAWERHQHSALSTYLLMVLLGVLLYIPGMFWIMLVSFGLQVTQVTAAWQQLHAWSKRVGVGLVLVVIILPLLLAITQSGSSLWLNWLGFPTTITPTNIPRNLLHAFSFFVWRGPATPTLWLDRLPILDFFSTVMLVLGIVFYARHASAARSRMLIGMFVVGAVFFAVQGPVSFSVLVPIVYFIVCAGIGYLLHDWLKVFPRNPLARGVGYGLISIVVALAAIYNLRAYFVAWPHNPTTKIVFHNRL